MIQDLSAQDPYYILPILMGISMFLLQKMSPTPVTDPTQQKSNEFYAISFYVLFFLWFPSGLVLYWLVSNLITIAQQQLIYRGLEKKGCILVRNSHEQEKERHGMCLSLLFDLNIFCIL